MSNLENKKALFGSGSGSGSVTAAKVSTTSKVTSNPASTATVISPELKAKKIAEARDYTARATKFLQTSVFQWSPDHLAAAPLFEYASNAYVTAGELDDALEVLEKSITSHLASSVPSAAALALVKASKIAQVIYLSSPISLHWFLDSKASIKVS